MPRAGPALGLLFALIKFNVAPNGNSTEILSFVTHSVPFAYVDSNCKMKLHLPSSNTQE
jgi:hypothetical protein